MRNTSWAELPRRATSFQPPINGAETRRRRLGLRPRTRLITAGVIVSTWGWSASLRSKGISPSTYVLWVMTTRPMATRSADSEI